MWHPQLTRRLRVLLYSKPLLELSSLNDKENLETNHYDALTLAIYVLDRIVESMGLDDESNSGAVIDSLKPLLIQMDLRAQVEPNAERHQQFAKKILRRLQKIDPIEYGDFDKDQAVRRQLEFNLISERYISDERFVLELSSEAINLFLNVFDFDVEDAQIAYEAVTLSQLKNGNIEKAAASARDARFRSIQFQTKIREILRNTKRDLSQLDWRDNVPKMLDQALAHIRERVTSEEYIIDSARDRIALMEPDSKEASQTRAISN